ncbi:MAG: VOC family protein [Nevskia sp.]|nr:VOC family protein [Nevskia sp.]
MLIQAYLNFEGRCDEAIEFYRRALDAEVTMLMRFKDSPEPHDGRIAPEAMNKVMHSSLRIGETIIMATDGFGGGKPQFQGITLSLAVADADQAQKRYAALADGGEARMPLAKTFFSPCFGMLTDRFGVQWMVIVPA